MKTKAGKPDKESKDDATKKTRFFWNILSKLKTGSTDPDSVRDAVEELIEEQTETDSPGDQHERTLLSNVLKQRHASVFQIMVPRADIVSIESSTPMIDAIKLLVKEGHSRLPVYRDKPDDIIGMVHIKDLANATLIEKSGTEVLNTLTKELRPIIFVAPATRVLDLLLEMRMSRTHMAMVVDEHGGIDGLVTIEDLVEQIVGDIADEHDESSEPELIDYKKGIAVADARVLLSDFAEKYGNIFTEEEISELDTLGGLVFKLTGRIPSRGELIKHQSGLEFEIIDADPRKIRRLRLRNIPEKQD
jgi:magnesium and cobalt transporter